MTRRTQKIRLVSWVGKVIRAILIFVVMPLLLVWALASRAVNGSAGQLRGRHVQRPVPIALAPDHPTKPEPKPKPKPRTDVTGPHLATSNMLIVGHFENVTKAIAWLKERGADLLLMRGSTVIGTVSLTHRSGQPKMSLHPPPPHVPQGVWRDATRDITSRTGPLAEGNRVVLVWPTRLWSRIKAAAHRLGQPTAHILYKVVKGGMVVGYKDGRTDAGSNRVLVVLH